MIKTDFLRFNSAPTFADAAEATAQTGSETMLANIDDSDGPKRLNGARAELVHINATIAEAQAKSHRLAEPVATLRQLRADHELATRDLEVARADEQSRIATWLSDCRRGERPGPSEALLHSEMRYSQTAEELAVAERALPNFESETQHVSETLRDLSAQRAEVHKRAVLEAVAEYLEGQLIPARRRAHDAEKNVWDIHDSCAAAGDQIMSCKITELVRAAKDRLPPPSAEPNKGRAFIDALLCDPDAKLGGN
jgi:hypothetical protein